VLGSKRYKVYGNLSDLKTSTRVKERVIWEDELNIVLKGISSVGGWEGM